MAFGAAPGPVRPLDPPGVLDVLAADDSAELLGRAMLSGWLLEGRRPVPTYRVMIGGAELSGLFTCSGRRFKVVEA